MAIIDSEYSVDFDDILLDCGGAVAESVGHLVGREIFIEEFNDLLLAGGKVLSSS